MYVCMYVCIAFDMRVQFKQLQYVNIKPGCLLCSRLMLTDEWLFEGPKATNHQVY
jgi:hypothetical protein